MVDIRHIEPAELRRVEIDARAGRGTVHVDGHDLSGAVHSLVFRAGADQIPEVELDLAVFTARVHGEAGVRLVMPDEARQALITLGWTPPPGEIDIDVPPK